MFCGFKEVLRPQNTRKIGSENRKLPHFREVRKFAQPISFENKQMLAFSSIIAKSCENRPNIFFCAKMFIKFLSLFLF